jgi:hypothetical protein
MKDTNDTKNVKQYGFKFDIPSPEHYVFGGVGNVPMEILQPGGDWRSFITEHEVQNLKGYETNACVIFTMLRCIEILIKRKYNISKDYSKRFLAAMVDTSIDGCSPQQAAEILRAFGVCDETVWPFSEADTKEKFFAPIPQAVKNIAKEFLNEFDFKHDFVPPNPVAIASALECSPLLFSASAWFKNGDRYYFPPGMNHNHATTLVYEKETEYRQVYDSYADGEGDPFLKEIEWMSLPMVVKRFWIESRVTAVTSPSPWQWLFDIIRAILEIIKKTSLPINRTDESSGKQMSEK